MENEVFMLTEEMCKNTNSNFHELYQQAMALIGCHYVFAQPPPAAIWRLGKVNSWKCHLKFEYFILYILIQPIDMFYTPIAL